MLGVEWGVGQVLLTFFWLAVFFIWIVLLLNVFADVFRSHDMSGGVKALWVIFVILFPYLGVFVYLIPRGDQMTHNAIAAAHQNQAAATLLHSGRRGPARPTSSPSSLRSRRAVRSTTPSSRR